MSAAEHDRAAAKIGPWSPLRHASFRSLWVAWVAACICMWMNDVAAAWLMTSLTTSPVMVALVQSAATLPILLIGLPSGAIADIVDRRHLLIFTQAWAVVVAVALFATTTTSTIGPLLLLVLVFANGMVLAVRWPVFSAIIPELVPKPEIPTASALVGIANNSSRLAGPLLAAMIIAAFGSALVFAANALLSIISAVLLTRWRYVKPPSELPSERFASAMRIGLQHVRQSPRMQFVLLRVACFFVPSIALIALLPLVARQLGGADASTYTSLIAAMGLGALIGAMLLPVLNRRLTHDRRFTLGALAYAAATVATAMAPHVAVALVAMVATGTAFMVAANTTMVVGILTLPDWVRARGLSIYQMVWMGSSALGAAMWGYIASATSVRTSLLLSAVAAVAALLLTRRALLDPGPSDDPVLDDGSAPPQAAMPVAHHQGPVLVTVEYEIDPARTAEFLALMRDSRRVWLGNGLMSWNLFGDVDKPGHHVEHMVDDSWADYMRRIERVSQAHAALQQRKRAMHVGSVAPVVRRYLTQPGRRPNATPREGI